MRLKTKLIGTLIGFFIILQLTSIAQWQTDANYGMKINIPSDWSKNAYMDGTDQVYDFYSADQNAAVQLRAFKADAALSTDLLIQVYEQSMLPEGTQRQSLKDHVSVQGIPGKQAVYVMSYDGNSVSMAAFYAIQNGNGYVLTAIIPTNLLSQKTEEVKKVTQSFTVNGFRPQANTTPATAKVIIPSANNQATGARSSTQSSGARPTQQNSGARPSQQNSGARPSSSASIPSTSSSQGDIHGIYRFYGRSDGQVLTNYHYIVLNADFTYEESYEPKHSPGYKGGHKGRWEEKQGKLYLHPDGGGNAGVYTIRPNEIERTTDNGISFLFKKE